MDTSGSKHFCGIRAIKTTVATICLLFIFAWSYYAYVYHFCLSRITSIEVVVLYLIVYHIVLVFFLWSFFKTMFTEPDGVPVEFRVPRETHSDDESVEMPGTNAVLEFADDLPIVTCTNNGDIRLCGTCRTIKPDRSHHCRVCGKCILKMDHHCVWLNNCVSYSNYKYFILFLAYGLTMSVYVVATTAAECAATFWDDILFSYNMEHRTDSFPHDIFLMIFATTFSIFFSGFFAFHIYLISKNRTTVEFLSAPTFLLDTDANGFNLGCCRNAQEVFGKEILLWPFPIDTKLGDGVRFPLTTDLRSNRIV